MTNVDLENKEINVDPVKEPINSSEQNEQIENEAKNKKPMDRCHVCNKKLGLIPFKCRCDGRFCALHRHSVKHSCDFDYRGYGKEKLEKDNPMIKTTKIDKI